MSQDTIQARYDELITLATRFRRQAEHNEQLQRSLHRSFQALHSDGWKGKGADAFFTEMQQTVFPAAGRLRLALIAGDEVLREIGKLMRAAEQEAAAPFRDGNVNGALPSVVSADPGAFDDKRQPYQLGTPKAVANHTFASGGAPALQYDVTINGRTIPVFVPKNGSAAGKIHTIDEVAKGLAALPAGTRAVITRVDVDPKANPADAFWAKQYGDPNFTSYMTAGSEGIVRIYPQTTKQSQDYLDGTLHHESGHTLSQKAWGESYDDKRWTPWKDAITKDPGLASAYAKNAPGEDFAETYQLYHQVKGTPQEAVERKRMPERFKIIDALEAGKK